MSLSCPAVTRRHIHDHTHIHIYNNKQQVDRLLQQQAAGKADPLTMLVLWVRVVWLYLMYARSFPEVCMSIQKRDDLWGVPTYAYI